jgi:hypothetical protein
MEINGVALKIKIKDLLSLNIKSGLNVISTLVYRCTHEKKIKIYSSNLFKTP